MLNEKLVTIDLEKFEFNLDLLSNKPRYLGGEQITHLQYEDFFGCLDPLISYERSLTDDLSQ
jgi:hypothetical protein